MSSELLEMMSAKLPAAGVRAVFANDVRGTALQLAFSPKLHHDIGTVVACSFAATPTVHHALERIASALAEVVETLWPGWYPPLLGPFAEGVSAEARQRNELAIDAAIARVPGVLPGWLRAAVARRTHELRLAMPHLPLETNVAQLALAVAADKLSFVLALEDLGGDEVHRRSFARACEWIGAVTRSRVVAVVPSTFSGNPCFDPISRAALHLDDASLPPPAKPLTTVFPVAGRPHPGSKAEQKLHAALGRDAMLAEVLAFNQRVDTTRGASYVVDLLWRAGGVIVEIDGWETHGNRRAFISDRHRDYELSLSGFTVLRITNEEIERDIEIAVDKIRDLVREKSSILGSNFETR